MQRMPTSARPAKGILKGVGTLDSSNAESGRVGAGATFHPGSTRGTGTQHSGSSLHYKSFHGRWWSVSDWIYWAFSGSTDPEKMRAQLRIFPLKFRDKAMEKAYVNYLAGSYLSRCVSFSALTAICILLFIVLTALYFSLKIVREQISYVLPVVLPLMLPLLALAAFMSRIPVWSFTKKEPELYTLLTLCGMSLCYMAVLQRFSTCMQRPYTLSATVGLKVWCDAWTFGSYMISIIAMFATFRIRISRAIVGGWFVAICFASPFVTQIVIKVPKNVFVPWGVTTKFLNAVTGVQLFCIFGLVHLTMGAKFYKEIIDRMDFTRRQSRLKQVVALVTERKRRKKGSTLVEDLLDLMEKARNVITVVMLKNTDSNALADATAVLDECLDCLRNTDELFAVHVGGEGDQGDYMRLYAHSGGRHAPSALTDARDDVSPAERTVRALLDVPFTSTETVTPDPVILARILPDIGKQWKVDFLQLKKDIPQLILYTGTALLQPYIIDLQTMPQVIHQFLNLAESKYADNPYHNDAHGAMVAHVAYFLVSNMALFSTHNNDTWALPAVIIAGLCHDVGHPGCNNAFFVNSYWKLAQLYNDSAVLENYHACLTFTMLAHTQTDVFARYSIESLREIRKRIVEMILATDMSQHFESLSRFRLRKNAADFTLKDNLEDAWLAARMCIKAADLGHAMIDWQSHVKWSVRVTEEFYKQGEAEEALRLPISPLCNRHAHGDFAKSQKGFLEFVVMPLLRELEEVDTTDTVAGELTRGLVYNRFRWDELAAADELVEIPEEVRATDVHYDLPLSLLQSEFKSMVTHRQELVKAHYLSLEKTRAVETAALATPQRDPSSARRGAIAI